MPLILTIENETSMPDGGPLSVTVTNKRGIDIGRDQYLDWVLHDPSRFISGKHCEIRFSDGQYWLRDVSTNGTFINRSEFRPDGPHALQSGDQIEIGRYIISVRIEPDGDAGFAGAPAAGAQSGALWDIGGEAPPPVHPNELRAPVAPGSRPDFLDWAADIAPARTAAPAYTPPPAYAPPPIYPAPPPAPSDWNMPSPARPAPLPPAAPAVWSMDDLPAPPPSLSGEPAPAPPAPQPAPPAATHPAADALPVTPEGQTASPSVTDEAETAPVVERSAPVMPAAPVAPAQPPTPSPAMPLPPRSAPTGQTSADAEFIARFARAAGIPEDVVRSRDFNALADLLGIYVRVTADNLRQLHAARAQSKGAMRSANVTMIQLMDNNPLRFSPNTDDALRILFGPATNSYLDAPRTLESSFGDLKKHQVQVFSAMQTALRQLMSDLDPKSIETSIPSEKSVGSLLRSREARLWDHYQTMWKARAGTSEHGMLDVFMRLFAEAYDKG